MAAVISGDILPDLSTGFHICSGDKIAYEIAKEIEFDSLISDTPESGQLPIIKAQDGVEIDRLELPSSFKEKVNDAVQAVKEGVVDEVVFLDLSVPENLIKFINDDPDLKCTKIIK